MTTMTASRPVPIIGTLLICGVLAIMMLAAVASRVTTTSHAVAKHGAGLAAHARNCSMENRVFQVWKSAERGNFAEVCDLNGYNLDDRSKTWTIRIIDSISGEEITVFRHTGNYMSLQEYLINQLYVLP